ncbi:hypothetical protein T10_11550 [Trichinella papuae]|uniref:Uncharacterized protein n=1 Tax=Trichinella papuae TaxID=268474 RepID=A0A0V1MLR7_9BILA|nr:hypothetical protein T10_11550 [Trichinella papuae]
MEPEQQPFVKVFQRYRSIFNGKANSGLEFINFEPFIQFYRSLFLMNSSLIYTIAIDCYHDDDD